MSELYDVQLDFLRGTSPRAMGPGGASRPGEAFLFLKDGRVRHFVRGQMFPERASFLDEVVAAVGQHRAVGVAMRTVRELEAAWPVPESDDVVTDARRAALVVLRSPGVNLLWAAGDMTDLVPWPEREIKNEKGYVEGTYVVGGGVPRLSDWIEMSVSQVPREFDGLRVTG